MFALGVDQQEGVAEGVEQAVAFEPRLLEVELDAQFPRACRLLVARAGASQAQRDEGENRERDEPEGGEKGGHPAVGRATR